MNGIRTKSYLIIILAVSVFISASERPKFGGRLIYLSPDDLGNQQQFLKANPGLIYEPLCYTDTDGCYSMIFEKMVTGSSSIHLILKDGLRWHDNSPVTAEEVETLIKTALEYSPFRHLVLKCSVSRNNPLISGRDSIIIELIGDQNGENILRFLSTVYLRDKFRFSGPFYPEKKPGRNLVLTYNLNCPSGRALADKFIYTAVPLAGIIHSWIDCRFCLLELNGADKITESFKNKYRYIQRPSFYYLLFGNGFSFDERKKLACLVYEQDFVKGLFEGRASKIEKQEDGDSTEETTESGITLDNIKQVTLYYNGSAFDRRIAERIAAILSSRGIRIILSINDGDNIDTANSLTGRFLVLDSSLRDNNNESSFEYSIVASALKAGIYIGMPDELQPVSLEDIQKSESLLFLFEIKRFLFYSPGMTSQKTIADYWSPVEAVRGNK